MPETTTRRRVPLEEISPSVREIKGGNKFFQRHWVANFVMRMAVDDGYYEVGLKRNDANGRNRYHIRNRQRFVRYVMTIVDLWMEQLKVDQIKIIQNCFPVTYDLASGEWSKFGGRFIDQTFQPTIPEALRILKQLAKTAR